MEQHIIDELKSLPSIARASLALQLGVTAQTVYNWSAGHTTPPPGRAAQLTAIIEKAIKAKARKAKP